MTTQLSLEAVDTKPLCHVIEPQTGLMCCGEREDEGDGYWALPHRPIDEGRFTPCAACAATREVVR